MDVKDRIPPEEQKQYVLLENTSLHYEKHYGWKPGTVLKRISKWYGSNGLGRHLKQAYFVPADSDNIYGHIAWNDHVEEITGQLKLDI
ncbi:hypothetical protein [Cytobacillus oceanisediminis]|uniref:hypothetical protein n=1 Tax=Cytobacillus oceanisediminis TaxID=665099 RepID=UPI002079CD18|nr:hypothetical protein [Cytobacillus oceanisediminis]USK43744.1 hypothetical protein LIT27_24720 [Cytobacillus oceanisediminis]